jgi:hypothetical protein
MTHTHIRFTGQQRWETYAPRARSAFFWTSTKISISISSADDIHFEIFIVSNCLLVNNSCKANSRPSKIGESPSIFNLKHVGINLTCVPCFVIFMSHLHFTISRFNGMETKDPVRSVMFTFFHLNSYCGAQGSVVVKALCNKPEVRGFDARWGEFFKFA